MSAHLVCPDGGGACDDACEFGEGCPGPVPAPPVTDLRPLLEERAHRWLGEIGAQVTPSEFNALVDLCSPGLTSCEAAAARRDVSPETIRQHRKRLYRKTWISSADEARAAILHVALREIAGRMS